MTPLATRGVLARNRMAFRTFRDKKQQQSRASFFDVIFLSKFPWITEKELEQVIENKGDEFRWKKTCKFHSGGEKMRNDSGQQGENELP